jgi:hypothetical protein
VSEFTVPPLMPTEAMVAGLRVQVPPDVRKTGVLRIERRWVADSLPDWELLDALAHCFGVLATLIEDAHRRCGHATGTVTEEPGREQVTSTDHLGGRLPCMVATDEMRSLDLNLRTGALLMYDERSVRYDRGAGEQASTRYGLERPSATLSPDDPFAWAEQCVDMSKKMLAKDGYHRSMVFLFPIRAGSSFVVLPAEDQQDKYLRWERIANAVERTDATGLVIIDEVWIVPADAANPTGRPSEMSNRREALVVTVATADGRDSSYTTLFNWVGNEIQFEETMVTAGDRMFFLEPVRRVWRRRSVASDTDPS